MAKRELPKVIIVNPEAIPLARDRLTLELIKLQEKQLRERKLADLKSTN